jgi:hypothetical protein
VTSPYYNPNQQIFAGYSNNQYIDNEVAKQLLATAAPDLMANEQARAQLSQYVDSVTAAEGFVTPQRVAELALAARTALGGNPQQLAHAKLVEQGYAIDRTKLPAAYATQIANIPDEQIVEMARMIRTEHPDWTQKQAIDHWMERAAKMNEGLQVSPVVGLKDTADGMTQTIRGVAIGNAG